MKNWRKKTLKEAREKSQVLCTAGHISLVTFLIPAKSLEGRMECHSPSVHCDLNLKCSPSKQASWKLVSKAGALSGKGWSQVEGLCHWGGGGVPSWCEQLRPHSTLVDSAIPLHLPRRTDWNSKLKMNFSPFMLVTAKKVTNTVLNMESHSKLGLRKWQTAQDSQTNKVVSQEMLFGFQKLKERDTN